MRIPASMRDGVTVALLWLSTVAFSWLAMMAVHEFGHAIHAFFSGGTVRRMVLHPLAISRTDVEPNPHPLLVVWGGPLWGCVIPVGFWLLARRMRWRWTWLAAFFAGFCLIANGAYIGSGVWFPVGDAEVMRRLGTPLWLMLAFGTIAIASGLRLWNGLGPSFGLTGDAPDRTTTVVLSLVTVAVIGLELALSRRI